MKIRDYPIVHNPVTYENALAGNRTPVSRVAGENSTTEPPMRCALAPLSRSHWSSPCAELHSVVALPARLAKSPSQLTNVTFLLPGFLEDNWPTQVSAFHLTVKHASSLVRSLGFRSGHHKQSGYETSYRLCTDTDHVTKKNTVVFEFIIKKDSKKVTIYFLLDSKFFRVCSLLWLAGTGVILKRKEICVNSRQSPPRGWPQQPSCTWNSAPHGCSVPNLANPLRPFHLPVCEKRL